MAYYSEGRMASTCREFEERGAARPCVTTKVMFGCLSYTVRGRLTDVRPDHPKKVTTRKFPTRNAAT